MEDSSVITMNYVSRQQVQASMWAGIEQARQHEIAALATHQASMHNRMISAFRLNSDHHVGALDPETVAAFNMGISSIRVRSTAKSREHIAQRRKSEGTDVDRALSEVSFALAHAVMFKCSDNDRVHLIGKWRDTRVRFYLVHLKLDRAENEWVLESLNPINRGRAIFEHRSGTWNFSPAAIREYTMCRSPYG